MLLVLLPLMFVATSVDPRSGQAYAVNLTAGKALGATRLLALPKMLTSVTPIGFAVSAAIVAIDTADIWVPIVRGALDSAGDTIQNNLGGGCKNVTSWSKHPATDDPTATDGYSVLREWTCAGSPIITAGITQTYTLVCKLANNAGYTQSTGTTSPTTAGVQGTGSAVLNTIGCPVGAIPVELDLPSSSACSGGYSCSTNGLRYGTASTHAETEYTTTATCKRTDGTTFTYSVTSNGGENPGVPLPSCSGQTPGARPTSYDFRSGPIGYSANGPIRQKQAIPSTSTEYPSCVTGTACLMRIQKDGSDCVVGDAVCADWLGTAQTQPTRIGCAWGPYLVALAQCGLMEGAYREGGALLDAPGKVDGDPATSPAPAPSAPPGTASPAPSASPAPAPAGVPSRTINPDGSETETTTETLPDGSTRTVERTRLPDGSTTTTTTTATPAGAATVTTVLTPPLGAGVGQVDTDGCLAQGWSWNPVSWVLAPMKCALLWAFVPAPAKVDQVMLLKDQLGTKVPFGYVGQATAVLGAASADAAGPCNEGPTATVSGYVFKPLNLCSGPLGEALPTTRPVLTVVMWLGILVPFGMWLFRQSVPVVGGGEQA